MQIDFMIDSSIDTKINHATKSIPRHLQWKILQLVLILNDVFMIGAAFRLAYYIRFESDVFIFQLDIVPSLAYYQLLVFFLSILLIFIYAISGLYNRNHLLIGTEEYSRVFRASSTSFLIVIIAGFLEPELIIARGWLLMAWALTFLLTGIGRFLLRRVVRSLRSLGYFLSSALIIGANQEGRWLAGQLMNWRVSGLHVIGFIDKKEPTSSLLFNNLRCLGDIEQLDKIIKKYDIEELILASSAYSSRDALLEVFKNYGTRDDIKVRMSSGLYEIVTTGLTVSEIAYVPLVNVNKVRLTGFDRIFKLIMDYVITIPGLILLSPFLLLIALLIKLDSPGPVIHRRRVMGVNGSNFDAYKFRSMHINGDELLDAHPDLKEELAKTHKLKNDPRVTRMGRFMRKFSIDELPQLINVLKREMSLVGPRMISPEEIPQYKQFDINLLTVHPGITGLWQVSGRSDVTYDERVQLDMYYVRNWTIWLDIQLLVQTIPAVVKGHGAY
jgi:exopolysaccharide biosynthesis polyprenyl glycosylphosphotransferase